MRKCEHRRGSNEEKRSTKKDHLSSTPVHLLIQLNHEGRELIAASDELDLWRYMMPKPRSLELFDLKALIEWTGRGKGKGDKSSGHYRLYVKVGETWYIVDDQKGCVREVTDAFVKTV